MLGATKEVVPSGFSLVTLYWLMYVNILPSSLPAAIALLWLAARIGSAEMYKLAGWISAEDAPDKNQKNDALFATPATASPIPGLPPSRASFTRSLASSTKGSRDELPLATSFAADKELRSSGEYFNLAKCLDVEAAVVPMLRKTSVLKPARSLRWINWLRNFCSGIVFKYTW